MDENVVLESKSGMESFSCRLCHPERYTHDTKRRFSGKLRGKGGTECPNTYGQIGISGEETPLSPRHLPGGHVPSSRGGFLFSVPDVCFFRVPRDLVARLPLY